MLNVDDRAAIDAFRAALDAGGYSGPALDETLSVGGRPFTREGAEVPLYLRLLPEGQPLSTLIKLFLLDVPVAQDEAERALAPLDVERAKGLGVVEEADGRVTATIDIFPTVEVRVASDHYEEHRYPTRSDHVLGLSLSSRVLACLTVRRPARRALDLGTGSGVHALFAAPHAEHVVGTDVNGRALRFAAFNARLNGFDNVELREGSLFEPVEGETFDLVVSNPPYVISPETEYVYRDSGLPGDSFCEGLIQTVPRYLDEGGLAHVLVEWAHEAEEPWAAPLRRWVEGSGCDALLFHYTSHDRSLGIERIGWGAIVLRKRSGASNWISEQKIPNVEAMSPASDQVERLLAGRDLLESVDGEGLLETRLRLAPEHVLEELVRLGEGGGAVQRALLKLTRGLGSQVALDVTTVHLLGELDGRRPLGDVLAQVAAEAGDGEPERFAAAALPGLSRLVELGFLVQT
jgi:methylase of polypeptide subunit release factors